MQVPSQRVEVADEAIPLPPLSPAPPPKPRVWTVFAVYALAFVVVIATQVAIGVGMLLVLLQRSENLQQAAVELQRMVTTPAAFIGLGLVSQGMLLAAALLPAWLSPEPLKERLAASRVGFPWWSYPVVAVGALLPLAIGISLAHAIALVIPPDPSAKLLYQQMTWPIAVPFVLFIAVAPGVAEELLFRGYIQKRLLQRWSPVAAILVTSLLFGVMHITPHSVVNAFVIGIWLGVLAWRTGSVWPGVACHAFINGSWNAWHVSSHLGVFPETPPLAVWLPAGLPVVVCFGATVWMIVPRPAATRAEKFA